MPLSLMSHAHDMQRPVLAHVHRHDCNHSACLVVVRAHSMMQNNQGSMQTACAGPTRNAGVVAFIDTDVAVELPSVWLAWIQAVVNRQAQSLPHCRQHSVCQPPCHASVCQRAPLCSHPQFDEGLGEAADRTLATPLIADMRTLPSSARAFEEIGNRWHRTDANALGIRYV